MKKRMSQMWYQKHLLCWLLLPFSAFYFLASIVRRNYLKRFKQVRFPVPVIVVGNLSVGGVGKTPLVIELVHAIQAKSLRVGVVSRGYGAKGRFPRFVSKEDDAKDVGDEPLLITKRTGAVVAIAPNRVEAIRYLLQHHRVDVIVSDDGLQHYAMGRSLEIAVIDGMRRLGNGFVLPAGPLRETVSRLKSVDFVVVNDGEWDDAYHMKLQTDAITSLRTGEKIQSGYFKEVVAAVAAIGNPERFFATLRQLKLRIREYSFNDHYPFASSDLVFNEKNIIMTEKDAVKCQSFATENMYFLPVKACLEQRFWDAFWKHEQLKEVLQK